MAFLKRGNYNVISGRVNNSPIGDLTPTTGAFTTLSTTSNALIGGNLYNSGLTTMINSSNLSLADPHIYLNNTYTANTTKSGGLVVNRLPTSSVLTTTGAGVFTPGVNGVSNSTISLSGATAAVLTTGMLIQISGATNASNNGLFEVQANNTATLLTLRGFLTGTIQDFTQSVIVSETNNAVTIRNVNVSIIRNNAVSGHIETSFGNTSTLTFLPIVGSTSNSSTNNGIAFFADSTGSKISSSTATMSSVGNMNSLNSLTFTSNTANPNTGVTANNSLWQRSTTSHINRAGNANQVGAGDLEQIDDFRLLTTITPPSTTLPSAAFSPNGKYLAIGYRNSNVVYMYRMQGVTPTLIQTITPPAGLTGFGYALSFDYDGTRFATGSAGLGTGVAGSVYVYFRASTTFALEYNSGNQGLNTGYSVNLNYAGDVAVCGQPDDGGGASKAFVITRSGVTWSIGQTLIAIGGNAKIGYSTSISWDASRILVVSTHNDTTLTNAGAVYIFKRNSPTVNTWTQELFTQSSEVATGVFFGWFGTAFSSNGSTFISPAERANGGASFGKLYVFKRSGTTWTQTQIILPPDLALAGLFEGYPTLSGDASVFVTAHYNGTNSRRYIYRLGGNGLYYLAQTIAVGITQGSGGDLKWMSTDGQKYAIENVNGGIDLYYNVVKNHVHAPSIASRSLAYFNTGSGKTLYDSLFTIDDSFNLTLPASLKVDTIVEKTLNNGVNIASVGFKTGAINLLTATSNPGNSNTLWQRTSDGHILRGTSDLETNNGFITTYVTTSPFAVPIVSATLIVDSSTAKTLNLPAATNRLRLKIMDNGTAATNNITITANGANTINGVASYVINANYGVVELISNAATIWSVFLS